MAGLSIYSYNKDTNQFEEISSGNQNNPLTSVHNGTDGQVVVQKLYLHHSENNKWYSAITLAPTPSNLVSGEASDLGWSLKLLAGDAEPATVDWSARVAGENLLSGGTVAELAARAPKSHYLVNMGAAGAVDNGYYPLWVQVTVPKGTRNQTHTGIKLDLNAVENNA